MVQAMSLFNQLLHQFPSLEFAALVRKHKAERAAKGHLPDATGSDAVLPVGACRLAARDLQRAGLLSGQADSSGNRPRRPTSPRSPMPTSTARRHCSRICFRPRWSASGTRRAGRAQNEVPFQKQAAVDGFDHHQPVSGDVSVGEVPPRQGRRQGARGARPRRLYAALRADHRSPAQRCEDGRAPFRSIPVRSSRWIAATTTTRCSRSGPMEEIYFVTRLKDNAAYEVVEEGPVPANRQYPCPTS